MVVPPLFSRFSSFSATPSVLSMPLSASSLLLLLLPALVSAAGDCKALADGVTFDLGPLRGLNSVTVSRNTPPTVKNITWTINPCGAIEWPKDTKKDEVCPEGSHVCGIEWVHNPADPTKDLIDQIIPISGNFGNSDATTVSPTYTRLKTSSVEGDANKEGLRVEMHGGTYPPGEGGKKQKAVVEYICDLNKSGLEGQDRDGKTEGEKTLKYVGYEGDVLKLEWKTKQACESNAGTGDGGDTDEGSHWGFFTWFIIIVFLVVAAYLIFGSWLNYNKYGHRGWDLLPHAEALRDVPYLLKDFVRKILQTVNGGGRRSGYSAV